MKRILKSALIAILAMFVFAPNYAYGKSSTGPVEYIVSSDGGEYLLSVYKDNTTVPVVRTGFFAEILEYTDSLSDNVSLTFGGVSIKENIRFSNGRYTLKGSLEMSYDCEISVEGGEIIMSGLKLKLNSAPCRIKYGKVVCDESEISASSSSAFILDYSSGAELFINGGTVSADFDGGAVNLIKGSVTVTGGKISNSVGTAIKNSSTLILSGSPEIKGEGYDIVTDTPITLSYNQVEFTSSASVKYLESFAEGSSICVFYSASENAIKNIRLYDINGSLMTLKYFDSLDGVREKNFGAVYLPYKVYFFCDGTLLHVEDIIAGKRLDGISAPEKIGYEFLGWCESWEDGGLYDFAGSVEKSFSLYAKYRLLPPSFSLSSVEFVYDGKEHNFGISSLEHPLFESALINYRWMCNGVLISDSGPSIKLSSVKESGVYTCTVSFTYGTDTVSVTTPAVSVNIKKAKISLPEILPKYYNGAYQSPDVYSTSFYTVSCSGGLAVGTYPVKFTLNDPENCEFLGGQNTEYADFEILKSKNFWTDEPSVFDVYEGMTPSHTATARFGSVEFLYSDKEEGTYSLTPPKSAGLYYCKARVLGCENYEELTSEPISFLIIKERVVGISIKSLPKKCEYNAFEDFNGDGLELNVTYNSSRSETVGAGKISFRYQTADSFRYGDTAVIASYIDVSIPIPVTVSKAEYDTSAIIFKSASVVFDGGERIIEYNGSLPMGLDGIPLTAEITGGGVNVGIYTVELRFSTLSTNYKTPAPLSAVLTITPYESEVVFSPVEFVYDGSKKCPSAYYTDVLGRKVSLSVSGARSLAGEYSATAYGADSNYRLIGESVKFRIAKADYDFSGVFWTDDGFLYDGYEKTVELSGLPQGVSVIGYSDNRATGAGKYTAKAALLYDEANYNPPPEITYEWVIEKADYDLTTFSFEDAEYVFSGIERYPSFFGIMPVGEDGIALGFRYSRGVTHVSEGRVKVDIIFESESSNYNIPEGLVAYVEIRPLGIAVSWTDLEFVYNTSKQCPTASASECQISVLGAKCDAGSYTATAVSLSSDYYILNPSVDFVIKKAENLWLQNIFVKDIFEDKIPSPSAVCLGGEVYYRYYTESGSEISEFPAKPGLYYVEALSAGNNNYNPIRSEKVSFSVIKIVPLKMSVSLNKSEYSAFEEVTAADISVTVENNDGSIEIIGYENIEILYSGYDSFRFGDDSVTVSCLGFSSVISVTVNKADYDMSGVFWSGGEITYDGTEKSITLLGLPDGVSVIEYIGGVGRDAGEYPASVVVKYDEDNYNPPTVPNGVLIIKKQTVSFPVFSEMVYNGSEQSPEIEDNGIYTVIYEKGKNAGVYPVTLVICDSLNYEFSDRKSEATVYFEIKARKLTLSLSDIDKYKLSSMPKPKYTVTDGELIDGDDLMLNFVYGKNEVSCTSSNPNYELTVLSGNITRHNSPAREVIFYFFLFFLLFITLVLITLVIILKRKDILHYISVVKCRFSPVVPPYEDERDTQKAKIESVERWQTDSIEDKLSIDVEKADNLITDALAKDLVIRDDTVIETYGKKKRIINVDTLSENFDAGENIDVNKLKEMNLIPYDTAYIKVLARGVIDKPLRVYANDFSLSAVKMIALTGGESIRVVTVKKKINSKNEKKDENA